MKKFICFLLVIALSTNICVFAESLPQYEGRYTHTFQAEDLMVEGIDSSYAKIVNDEKATLGKALQIVPIEVSILQYEDSPTVVQIPKGKYFSGFLGNYTATLSYKAHNTRDSFWLTTSKLSGDTYVIAGDAPRDINYGEFVYSWYGYPALTVSSREGSILDTVSVTGDYCLWRIYAGYDDGLEDYYCEFDLCCFDVQESMGTSNPTIVVQRQNSEGEVLEVQTSNSHCFFEGGDLTDKFKVFLFNDFGKEITPTCLSEEYTFADLI